MIQNTAPRKIIKDIFIVAKTSGDIEFLYYFRTGKNSRYPLQRQCSRNPPKRIQRVLSTNQAAHVTTVMVDARLCSFYHYVQCTGVVIAFS